MNGGTRLSVNGIAVVSTLVAIVALVSFLLSACGKSPVTDTSQTITSTQPSETTTPAQTQIVAWNPDGVLSAGEYSGTNAYANGNYEIRWRTDESSIYIGIRAKTTGWVAVGFNPTQRMKNVDMVFGYVVNDEVIISDQFSTGDFGPHQADNQLGGELNIIDFGGKEEGGYTIIEFKKLLNTGDNFDARLMPGTVPIIWSYGSGDDITIQHVNRGYGEINL